MRTTAGPCRLASHVRVEVRYRDESAFGGAVWPRLQANMRGLCGPIHRALEQRGPEFVVGQGERLLRRCFSGPSFKALCGAGYPRIPPGVVFPDPRSITPRSLVLTSADTGDALEIEVSGGSWRAAVDYVAGLTGAGRVPEGAPRRWSGAAALTAALEARGLIERTPVAWPRRRHDTGATFIGHNTVVVRSARAGVVVDPWFFPRARRYGAAEQPVQPHELGRVDAVLITHSHPDHFDPGSLLRLGRATRVIVPRVPRESVLALDMKTRLRELGFTAVTELAWWKTAWVGDIQVVALPFHGEQPTAGRRLYPEARNWGNCYLVRTPRLSCAFVADAGSDADGRVADVALEAYERYGPIDVLFSGYRGWSLYPVQFFESSVRHYLLFVPPELYPVRQTIMNTAEEAVNTAEAWHARYLAPYADGGAPWYAEIGLGPKGGSPRPADGDGWVSFDPPRERCVTALMTRSQPVPGLMVGSPVRPLLLQPGESCTIVRGTAVVGSAAALRGSGAGS